jgi:hypothetical protein
MTVFDPQTEEFLAAMGTSAKTYRPALTKFQAFLVNLPDPSWKDSATPLQLFLDKVEEDMTRPKRQRLRIARKTLQGFVDYLKSSGKSGNTVNTYVAAVQSMASFSETELTRKFVDIPKPKAKTKAYPWGVQMLEKFIKLEKKPLYQVITGLYWQSGLSVGDATRILYGGIKDEFEAEVCPICLDFTSEGRHKTGVEFRSFFGPETIELFKRYFKAEGTPEAEDPVFPVGERAIQKNYACIAEEILGSYEGRNPMAEHTIRKKFRTNIVNAGCPESYAEYFMGHNLGGDLRKTYTLMSNDQWRVEYKKVMPATAFKLPKVAV